MSRTRARALPEAGHLARVPHNEVLVNVCYVLLGFIVYKQLAAPACCGLPHTLPPGSTLLDTYPCKGSAATQLRFIFTNMPRVLWDLLRVKGTDAWLPPSSAGPLLRFVAFFLLPPRWYSQIVVPAASYCSRSAFILFHIMQGPGLQPSALALRGIKFYFGFELVHYALALSVWRPNQGVEVIFCCTIAVCLWVLQRWHQDLLSGGVSVQLQLAVRLLVPAATMYLEWTARQRQRQRYERAGAPGTSTRTSESGGRGCLPQHLGWSDKLQGEEFCKGRDTREACGNWGSPSKLDGRALAGVPALECSQGSCGTLAGGKAVSTALLQALSKAASTAVGRVRRRRGLGGTTAGAWAGTSDADRAGTTKELRCEQSTAGELVASGVEADCGAAAEDGALVSAVAAVQDFGPAAALAAEPAAEPAGPRALTVNDGPATSSVVGTLPPYRPFIKRRTFVVKIAWAEPEQLALDFRERLRDLVESRMADQDAGSGSGPGCGPTRLGHSFVRRGCVELTMVLEWAAAGAGAGAGAAPGVCGYGSGRAADAPPGILDVEQVLEALGLTATHESEAQPSAPSSVQMWELDCGCDSWGKNAAVADAGLTPGHSGSPLPRVLGARPRVLLLSALTAPGQPAQPPGPDVRLHPTCTPQQQPQGQPQQQDVRHQAGSSGPKSLCAVPSPGDPAAPLVLLRVEVDWGQQVGARGGDGPPESALPAAAGQAAGGATGPREGTAAEEADCSRAREWPADFDGQWPGQATPVQVLVRAGDAYLSARVTTCNCTRPGGDPGAGGGTRGGGQEAGPGLCVYDIEVLQLPPSPGLMLVELSRCPHDPALDHRCRRGVMLPLLVTDDPGLAGELAEAATMAAAGEGLPEAEAAGQLDGLLYDMGTWLGAATDPRVSQRGNGLLRGLGCHLLRYAQSAGWRCTEQALRRAGAGLEEEEYLRVDEACSAQRASDVSPVGASTADLPQRPAGASAEMTVCTASKPAAKEAAGAASADEASALRGVSECTQGVPPDTRDEGPCGSAVTKSHSGSSTCCSVAALPGHGAVPSRSPLPAAEECPGRGFLGASPAVVEQYALQMAGVFQLIEAATLVALLLRTTRAGLPLFSTFNQAAVIGLGVGTVTTVVRLFLPYRTWAWIAVRARLPRYLLIVAGKAWVALAAAEGLTGIYSPITQLLRLLHEGVILPVSCLLDIRIAVLVSVAKFAGNAAAMVSSGVVTSWMAAAVMAAKEEAMALLTTIACHAYLGWAGRRQGGRGSARGGIGVGTKGQERDSLVEARREKKPVEHQ